MKTSFSIYTITISIFFLSCKKEYTCECNTLGNKGVVFVSKTTEKDATKKCKYYENSETDCYIK
jgi:hypothetical protein